MNYKIIIDTLDNNEISQNISRSLYNRLILENYDAILLDNNLSIDEKISEINKYGNNTIVISNQMNNNDTSEIIYSLYYDNILPLLINDKLKNILNISKFYQLRLPSDTSQDYYKIIRETPLSESIIIRYENISSNIIDSIVNNLYDSIDEYILGENIYIVKQGDTLYSIARKLGVSVNKLIEVNNLAGSSLSIGQELIIPETKENNDDNNQDNNNDTPSPFKTYVVQKGDSLYQIARKFNTTVNEIQTLNDLSSNSLSIGQVLRIPSSSSENYQTYTVVSGDNLYKIANRFNTTVNELISLNNLSSNNLSIGQVLKIPSSSSENYQTYTVVSGDSLYKIANRFNTTVNELISLNNLSSNNLSIGQILKIPVNINDNYQTYTVVSGDSLYKIANRFNTTVNELISLNNLSSNNLSIGQQLLIPN